MTEDINQGGTDPIVLVEDSWSDTMVARRDDKGEGNQLITIERQTGLFLRDGAGRIVQRYLASSAAAGWLSYAFVRMVRLERERHRDILALKRMFTYTLNQSVLKLARCRADISVLEVGSTIGENFRNLDRLLAERSPGTTLTYFGFDIDEATVAASQIMFGRTGRFHAVAAETEIMSRLPDRSVDFVVSLGVLSHSVDAERAVADALRVARVAVVCGLETTPGDTLWRSRAAGGTGAGWVYTALPRTMLDRLAREAGATDRYLVSRNRFGEMTASDQGQYFIGTTDVDLDVTLDFWVLAKTPLFPEWDAMK